MKTAALLITFVMALLSVNSASAEMVAPVYQKSGNIIGVDSFTDTMKLDQGSYRLSLTDFQFPDAFAKLGVAVTTGKTLLASILLDGTSTSKSVGFQAGTGDYFLSLFGMTGSIDKVGLYGVDLSYSSQQPAPTPLPPSAALFISGLALCVLLRLRGRKTDRANRAMETA